MVAGNDQAAADAVQEAFVKAHLRWGRISKYDDPIGWVRRVAINHVRDDHRRSGRKRLAISRLGREDDGSVTTPEIDEFDRLLALLPKQQRAVTALFYVEGLSIEEIAVALGIASGTVKSHLHDARNGLRAMSRVAAQSLRITHNRMAHASEIVAQVGRRRLRYAELPVQILYTPYTLSKGQRISNSLNIVGDLLLGWLR